MPNFALGVEVTFVDPSDASERHSRTELCMEEHVEWLLPARPPSLKLKSTSASHVFKLMSAVNEFVPSLPIDL